MKNNKSTIIWTVVIIIVLVGLFTYSRLSRDVGSGIGSNVPCLTSNVRVLAHFHPHLTITVDGISEAIPGVIGNNPCTRQIHTHDSTGALHIEPQGKQRNYTLGDFFKVWGKSIEREDYVLEVTSNNQIIENPESLLFREGQQIMMQYNSAQLPAN